MVEIIGQTLLAATKPMSLSNPPTITLGGLEFTPSERRIEYGDEAVIGPDGSTYSVVRETLPKLRFTLPQSVYNDFKNTLRTLNADTASYPDFPERPFKMMYDDKQGSGVLYVGCVVVSINLHKNIEWGPDAGTFEVVIQYSSSVHKTWPREAV